MEQFIFRGLVCGTRFLLREILNDFMKKINFFHDCCIKELKYSSGAYVNNRYEMYPVNDKRILNVAFQCQSEENGMFELEFQGLKYLKIITVR